jgi:hypothetical protein
MVVSTYGRKVCLLTDYNRWRHLLLALHSHEKPTNYPSPSHPSRTLSVPYRPYYAYAQPRRLCRFGLWIIKKYKTTITGAIIMLAGGAIGYKTKFQLTIALSSTEGEFVSACEVGKMILYFWCILEDLHIPKNHANCCVTECQVIIGL